MYVSSAIVILIAIPVLILLIRFFSVSRSNRRYAPGAGDVTPATVDIDQAVQHLSRIIQIPSISHVSEEDDDQSLFVGCQNLLKEMYPDLFSKAEVFERGPYGIALKFSGSGTEAPAGAADSGVGEGSTGGDPSDAGPVLFTAHYDVVPIETDNWTHPPFSGETADGCIWGRGTLDTKNSLISILEALDLLAKSGWKPVGDIWVAFGGDEETSGQKGAASMAKWFEEQGIRFRFVFDEGAIIARDMLPGISGDIALVGIEEKGYANFVLETTGSGGHASSPRYPSPLGRLARALSRIEWGPHRARLTPGVRQFFTAGSFLQSGFLRLVMTNLWLFGPLLVKILKAGDSTRPLVTTTVAATVARGSSKDNVLPERASCNLNVRILPGETMDSVQKKLARIIRDPNVRIRIADERESNDPVVSTGDPDYPVELVKRGLEGIFDVKAVLPFMATVTTDSKHYARLADQVIRFVPMILDSRELGRIHGTDERFEIAHFEKSIQFFHRVMESL